MSSNGSMILYYTVICCNVCKYQSDGYKHCAVAYKYLCPKVKNQNIKFIYVYIHTHVER